MNPDSDTAESQITVPWLLLVHQIPPSPSYVRVKIGRRLHRLGAVAVKNSVWALPNRAAALEDLVWVAEEIRRAGGDASLLSASFVFGLRDADVKALFSAAREADYRRLLAEIRAAEKAAKRKEEDARDARDEPPVLARLRRRFREVEAIDFFGAEIRREVEAALDSLERALRKAPAARVPAAAAPLDPRRYRGRVWVTRPGVHIDRMASAWLVKRFVDPRARFSFAAPGATKRRGERKEILFDTPGGDFTHEGDLCTFEVLASRFGISDAALRSIGELVHDVDLKDGKFARPEAPGLARVVNGIALASKADEARLARAFALFDDLYEAYKKRR